MKVHSLVSPGGWNFAALMLKLSSCIINRILNIPTPLQNSSEDLLISNFVNHKGFILISAYVALFPQPLVDVDLSWIWKRQMEPKVKSLCGCYDMIRYLISIFSQSEGLFKMLQVLDVIASLNTLLILFTNVLKVGKFGGVQVCFHIPVANLELGSVKI